MLKKYKGWVSVCDYCGYEDDEGAIMKTKRDLIEMMVEHYGWIQDGTKLFCSTKCYLGSSPK